MESTSGSTRQLKDLAYKRIMAVLLVLSLFATFILGQQNIVLRSDAKRVAKLERAWLDGVFTINYLAKDNTYIEGEQQELINKLEKKTEKTIKEYEKATKEAR